MGQTTEEDISRKHFVAQVARTLLDEEGLASSTSPFINILDMDYDRKCVHELLQRCIDFDDNSLNRILKEDPITNSEFEGTGYVPNLHMMIAHYTQLSQEEMRARFGPILDKQVGLTVTALLWDQQTQPYHDDPRANAGWSSHSKVSEHLPPYYGVACQQHFSLQIQQVTETLGKWNCPKLNPTRQCDLEGGNFFLGYEWSEDEDKLKELKLILGAS